MIPWYASTSSTRKPRSSNFCSLCFARTTEPGNQKKFCLIGQPGPSGSAPGVLVNNFLKLSQNYTSNDVFI